MARKKKYGDKETKMFTMRIPEEDHEKIRLLVYKWLREKYGKTR